MCWGRKVRLIRRTISRAVMTETRRSGLVRRRLFMISRRAEREWRHARKWRSEEAQNS